MKETICAISTPHGTGGIAVIRVSGAEAFSIVDTFFKGKQRLQDAAGYSAHYGQFGNIDDVVVTVFRAPHSFTGEDTIEIACHGSLYIQQEILRLLIEAGCRPARPGEFTQQAFLNGKMDLSEAEAVADLIAAESKAAHEIALRQMRGGISTELKALRDRLLHFTSLIELELDFADHEDLQFADRTELNRLATEIEQRIKELAGSFHTGNALKNGIPVAIIGPTNAGKSTLLNALAGEERAIVSDIHGTTRDMVEETLCINGIQFRLIDTAGIRHTTDKIEELGIERSIAAAKKAAIVLLVLDATSPHYDLQHLECLNGKKVITILNKADLLQVIPQNNRDYLYISAAKGEIEKLKERLQAAIPPHNTEGVVVSNLRHYEALQQALQAIQRVQDGLATSLSGEFLSMDLQDCLTALGEITGEITSQDTLNNIFANFCIGK